MYVKFFSSSFGRYSVSEEECSSSLLIDVLERHKLSQDVLGSFYFKDEGGRFVYPDEPVEEGRFYTVVIGLKGGMKKGTQTKSSGKGTTTRADSSKKAGEDSNSGNTTSDVVDTGEGIPTNETTTGDNKSVSSSSSEDESSSEDGKRVIKEIYQLLLESRKEQEALRAKVEELERERGSRSSTLRREVMSPFKSHSHSSPSYTTSSTSSTTPTSTTTTTTTTTATMKESKPIKLTNITVYDGTTSFKDWLKMFNLKVVSGRYNDDTKLVTIMEYLSEGILKWLAQLDSNTTSTYNNLLSALQAEYGEKDRSVGSQLQKVLDVKQKEGESVATYAARLAAAREECIDGISDSLMRNVFLDGLVESIQADVRDEVGDEEDIDVVLAVARKKESNRLRTYDAQKRHARTPTNPSPSSIPANTPTKCVICKVNQPPPGKVTCRSCYKAAKSHGIPTTTATTSTSPTTTGANVNIPKLCTICSLRAPNPGKSWCESCYRQHVSVGAARTNARDFSKFKVKFATPNDESPNPKEWSSKKLKEEKRCFYCAELLTSHSSSCREKYPFYHSTEVLTLLRSGIVPPTRTGVPEGAPVSPP